ncbi:hypothetical protein A1D17_03690 [Pseudomonas fluorescens]|uniref:Uncharacterized protein n=1 Tax=Pseudomonas fluorescens TaxID=294 RepID=A0A166QPR6_PSEFL|nr:hypothetical protein A1D17_03690 [Pseudomonas fluorescens]
MNSCKPVLALQTNRQVKTNDFVSYATASDVIAAGAGQYRRVRPKLQSRSMHLVEAAGTGPMVSRDKRY